MVLSDIGSYQSMWAYLLDERGRFFQMKNMSINYRLSDASNFYNLFGNRLDFTAPLAGIFRFI